MGGARRPRRGGSEKRPEALLPTLVPALERHGHLCLDTEGCERLMVVRAAMIDRRLVPARAVAAGQRRRRRSRSAKKTRHGGRVRKHLPRARDAVRAVARVGRDSRCDGRPTARRARHTGSARVGFLRERAVRMALEPEGESSAHCSAIVSIFRISDAQPRSCAAGCVKRKRTELDVPV